VSASNDRPGGPPPDDFSKTTPNINLPDDSEGQSDWNKTNYKMPKQPPSDDWGKTVANIKPIDTSGQDFDKTYFPGSKAPSTPEWGVTNARVDVGGADFGTTPEDFGGSSQAYDKTTPYFRLPEAERSKYQNLPPTPSEQAAQEEREQQEKGGLPGWFWVLAGLVIMFLFAIVILGVAYFIIPSGGGYEATLKGAPPGSDVWVDGSAWGTTDADGNVKLSNLKGGGSRKVEIKNQLWECQPMSVHSENGVAVPNPLIAQCKQSDVKNTNVGDCGTFKPGEFDKAEICYNKALTDLDPDKFTAEELVKALSILIINFDKGKAEVPLARLSALQKGASFIKKLQDRDPKIVLEVGGHTDSDGSDASNMTLSQNRANAVKDILVKYGVAASGLQTRGYGATKPKYDNNTEDGKFLNRRIEYSIVASVKK
jgi:outer membrane protein OmpA-like peptidoglycan-associated protein